jgi:hypothetical protein
MTCSIFVATGQRPDLALTRELRLDLDPWLESPRALAPEIDPNVAGRRFAKCGVLARA